MSGGEGDICITSHFIQGKFFFTKIGSLVSTSENILLSVYSLSSSAVNKYVYFKIHLQA